MRGIGCQRSAVGFQLLGWGAFGEGGEVGEVGAGGEEADDDEAEKAGDEGGEDGVAVGEDGGDVVVDKG